MIQAAKVLAWTKAHLTTVFGALAAGLGAWIAIGSTRKKIAGLKAQVDLETEKAATAAGTAKAESHEEAAVTAGASADAAAEVVARETAHVAVARDATKDLTHDELLAALNRSRTDGTER